LISKYVKGNSRSAYISTDILDDRAIQNLSPALFRAWLILSVSNGRPGAKLPPLPEVALQLRSTQKTAKKIIDQLIAAKVIFPGGVQ
jgi:hypothetical protein